MLHAKQVRLTVAAMCAVISLSGGGAGAQQGAVPNPFRDPIENHFKLPGGRELGSTVAVDVDPDGRSIWVFERCGATDLTAAGAAAQSAARRQGRQECEGSPLAPILKFNASGQLVKSFGTGMTVHPHGFHVDREGNVWATDGAASSDKKQGHQVFKFSPDGKLLLTLGKIGGGDGLAGPDFFQPSDVLIAPNGDIFVADGHGDGKNGRVVKFSKDGKFIKAWGKQGTRPGEFSVLHSLAMDSRGRLFVGDRDNYRIQIFDQEGKFLAEWRQFGSPAGLFIDNDDTLYVADARSGEVRDGKKVNPPYEKGIYIGSARDGKVTGFVPDPDPDGSQEGVTVDAQGNLYAAQSDKQAVNKYVKK